MKFWLRLWFPLVFPLFFISQFQNEFPPKIKMKLKYTLSLLSILVQKCILCFTCPNKNQESFCEIFSAELCALSVDQGTCNNFQTRYAYSRQQGRCVQFSYRGCGGNLNNFPTLSDCNATCGNLGYRRRKRKEISREDVAIPSAGS